MKKALFLLLLALLLGSCDEPSVQHALSSPISQFAVNFSKTDSLLTTQSVTIRVKAAIDGSYVRDQHGSLKFTITELNNKLTPSAYRFTHGKPSGLIAYDSIQEYRIQFMEPGVYIVQLTLRTQDANNEDLLYDLSSTRSQQQDTVRVYSHLFEQLLLANPLFYGEWIPFRFTYKLSQEKDYQATIELTDRAALMTSDSVPIAVETPLQLKTNQSETFLFQTDQLRTGNRDSVRITIEGRTYDVLFTDLRQGESSWYAYTEKDKDARYRQGEGFTPHFKVEKNPAIDRMEVYYESLEGVLFKNGEFNKWIPYMPQRDTFVSKRDKNYVLQGTLRNPKHPKTISLSEKIEVIPHTFSIATFSQATTGYTFTLGADITENYTYGKYEILIDFSEASGLPPYTEVISGNSFRKEFTYGEGLQAADYHIQVKHLETGAIQEFPTQTERETITRLIDIRSTTSTTGNLLLPAYKPIPLLLSFTIQTNGADETNIRYYIVSNHPISLDRGNSLAANQEHPLPSKSESVYMPKMYNYDFYADIKVVAKDITTGKVISEKVLFDNQKVLLKTGQDFIDRGEFAVEASEQLILQAYEDPLVATRNFKYNVSIYFTQGPPKDAIVSFTEFVCIRRNSYFSFPGNVQGLADRQAYQPDGSDIEFHRFPSSVKVRFSLYGKTYFLDVPVNQVHRNTTHPCSVYVN